MGMDWVASLAARVPGVPAVRMTSGLKLNQLAREDRRTFLLSLSPLVPDDEILSLHVAKLTEALTKGVDQVGFEGGRRVAQIPNRHDSSGLLPHGGERCREDDESQRHDEPDGLEPHSPLLLYPGAPSRVVQTRIVQDSAASYTVPTASRNSMDAAARWVAAHGVPPLARGVRNPGYMKAHYGLCCAL